MQKGIGFKGSKALNAYKNRSFLCTVKTFQPGLNTHCFGFKEFQYIHKYKLQIVEGYQVGSMVYSKVHLKIKKNVLKKVQESETLILRFEKTIKFYHVQQTIH